MKNELSEKMIENLNDLGNLMTLLKWPTEERDTNKYDAGAIFDLLMEDYRKVMEMESDFHDCVNELCLKCGNYREEHNGACDGCRWQMKKQG